MRAALLDDYSFALALYLRSAKPLLARLGRWDDARVVSRFARGYQRSQVQIIRSGEQDIGWIQIAELHDRFALEQIHLVEGFCNRGIGTEVLTRLMRHADALGKAVSLNVMHGNRARELYERFGFEVVGEDADKLHMRASHPGAAIRARA